MRWKAICAASLLALLTTLAAAQNQEQYLDVFITKVKPEKRADFDAVAKKVAAANRQNKGDTWLAMETTYGEGNTVSFVSVRQSYGDIEKATDAFMGALGKVYGQAGTQKLFQDLNACVISSQNEVRRRRFDLSSNVPGDAAAMAKLVGEARWLRSTVVHVRPGQVLNFEAMLKDVKAASEKADPPQTNLVSQAVAGQHGTVFYITALRSSLGDFDHTPALPQLMGEEAYRNFLKQAVDVVSSTETVINHFLPELSNPPENIASAAPDFWNPKPPTAAAKAKPKAGAAKADDKAKQP